MPKVLEDLVTKLNGKVNNPWAVATSALQKQGILKKGTRELGTRYKTNTGRSKKKK